MNSSVHKSDTANLKLFKALDRMEEYDEEKLHKILRDELLSKNIAVLKQNLHRFIMKCLRNYHSQGNEAISMYEMLIEFSIMYAKKNAVESKRILSKLEKLATEYDSYEILTLCYKYERKLNIVRLTNKTREEIDLLNQKYVDARTKAHVEGYYDYLGDSLQEFYLRKGGIRKESDVKYVKKILADPYLKSKKYAITMHAEEMLYNLRGFCYFLLGEYEKCIADTQAQLDLVKKEIAHKLTRFVQYVAVYNNPVELNLRLDKPFEAIRLVNEFRQIPAMAIKQKWSYKIPKQIIEEIEIKAYRMELPVYFKYANFEKVQEINTRLESKVKKATFDQDGFAIATDNYYMAYTHFVFKNYKQALSYLQKILKHPDNEKLYGEDIYSYAKILQLIIHYELEDEQLSAYLLKSTYRFLAQRQRLYPSEEALMAFMKGQLHRSADPDSIIDNLQKLKVKLEQLSKNSYEKKVLDYFDFIAWIESKISRKPFIEVMKKKYYQALP
jgi:hypothetical protein